MCSACVFQAGSSKMVIKGAWKVPELGRRFNIASIADAPSSIFSLHGLNEKDGEVISVTCFDYAASAGGCKHGTAVLMWLHRRSEEPAPIHRSYVLLVEVVTVHCRK